MRAPLRQGFPISSGEDATRWCDAVLQRDRRHVEATVMRTELALGDGNAPFAAGMLRDALRLVPDSFELHEAMASVHFANQDFGQAHRHLDTAEKLGAPAWRCAFHRGLASEMEGDRVAAIAWYQASLLDRPDFVEAERRLAAMAAAE